MNPMWTVPGLSSLVAKPEENTIEKEAADKKLNLSKLLNLSTNLKAIHVKTRRYGAHMALDKAFEDLNEALDAFNEGVQGYYLAHRGGELKIENQEIKFTLPGDDGLLSACKSLEKDFTEAANGLVAGVAPLESLRDDVLNIFYQLYYRLNLKG